MFGPTLPALAEHHQVIAVDLQGHGRTADIDRPIDIKMMADDIAALIDHLGEAQAEATLGEICDALRAEWGEYREPARF